MASTAQIQPRLKKQYEETIRKALRDQFGRSIEYLRISVTDRCNFRCLYCMPQEGLQWLPRDQILTYEEIAEVVRQLAPLGLRRLRITGGEPTIRPNLPALLEMLRAVPQIEDIALSTNGVRMDLARALRDAGLDRVNMSADSLRPDRIASIARRGGVQLQYEGRPFWPPFFRAPVLRRRAGAAAMESRREGRRSPCA